MLYDRQMEFAWHDKEEMERKNNYRHDKNIWLKLKFNNPKEYTLEKVFCTELD